MCADRPNNMVLRNQALLPGCAGFGWHGFLYGLLVGETIFRCTAMTNFAIGVTPLT